MSGYRAKHPHLILIISETKHLETSTTTKFDNDGELPSNELSQTQTHTSTKLTKQNGYTTFERATNQTIKCSPSQEYVARSQAFPAPKSSCQQ
jgi:hypothetical protein